MYLFILPGNVSETESLFRDPFPLDERKRRQIDEYVPIFFNELTFTNEQIATCEGNKPCLFDLAVTNDTQFAADTKEVEVIANATIDILSKEYYLELKYSMKNHTLTHR